jgi:hypothetical protein
VTANTMENTICLMMVCPRSFGILDTSSLASMNSASSSARLTANLFFLWRINSSVRFLAHMIHLYHTREASPRVRVTKDLLRV